MNPRTPGHLTGIGYSYGMLSLGVPVRSGQEKYTVATLMLHLPVPSRGDKSVPPPIPSRSDPTGHHRQLTIWGQFKTRFPGPQ